jgi:hypothetical protein
MDGTGFSTNIETIPIGYALSPVRQLWVLAFSPESRSIQHHNGFAVSTCASLCNLLGRGVKKASQIKGYVNGFPKREV